MTIQNFKYLLLSMSLSLGTLQAQAATPYVRYNVNSTAGQANLKAMEVAFWKMKQMGCADPRSWYYQGAIHQVPRNLTTNPDCPDFVVKNLKPPVLKTAWSNCTHASADSPQRPASDLNFLMWHRLYTAHLEAVVRRLSGKADFTLPYFDYENIQLVTLPPLLQNSIVNPQSAIPAHTSALYSPSRNPRMNAGERIDPIDANALKKAIAGLDNNSLFINFSKAINASPHGAMHDYLGGDGLGIDNPILQTKGKDSSGLMADVKSAGFDPVFWLHHAAIDRLWTKWDLKNRSNPYARPTLQMLQQQPWPYVFFDANGQQTAYATTQDLYRAIYYPDYRYDDMPLQTLGQTKDTANLELNTARPLVKSVVVEKNLSSPLTSQVQTINLSTTTTNNSPLKFWHKLKQNLKAQSVKAWTLDLELQVTGSPVNNYQVFFVQGKEHHFIGIINFFGIEHQDHEPAEHAGHPSGSQLIKDQKSFEITKFYQSGQGVKLEISPVDGSSNADNVRISKVSVTAHQAP